MFVYSAISWEEIRSLPIFRACVRTCRYLLRRAATPTVSRSATCSSSPPTASLQKPTIVPVVPSTPWGEPSRGEAAPSASASAKTAHEYICINEVRERALAVDLDDGEVLAVAAFELEVAAD